MALTRKILLLTAAIVGLADVGYFLWLGQDDHDEMKAEWLAYMPTLEHKQRKHPQNFLNSSHYHDPDYPILSLYEQDGGYSLFSKIADDCKIREYIIKSYVGEGKPNEPIQMPDRFFLGKLSAEKESCLRKVLPTGYVLAQLNESVSPKLAGWGQDDLEFKDKP